jgi:hypothetical protein
MSGVGGLSGWSALGVVFMKYFIDLLLSVCAWVGLGYDRCAATVVR